MTTPEVRRARVDLLRSWWILFTLNPFWTQWVSFLYAGLRGRRRRWVLYAGVYFLLDVVSFVLIDQASPWDDIGVALVMALWAIAFIHALMIRREYLVRMDVLNDPRLERAEDAELRRAVAAELARRQPELARDSGLGRPDLPNAMHADLVDLNHASVRAIAELPGVDVELAKRIVVAREQVDGFSSIYDLGALLELPADVVDAIRDRAVCLPPEPG